MRRQAAVLHLRDTPETLRNRQRFECHRLAHGPLDDMRFTVLEMPLARVA
jgi:hypothetical protein